MLCEGGERGHGSLPAITSYFSPAVFVDTQTFSHHHHAEWGGGERGTTKFICHDIVIPFFWTDILNVYTQSAIIMQCGKVGEGGTSFHLPEEGGKEFICRDITIPFS